MRVPASGHRSRDRRFSCVWVEGGAELLAEPTETPWRSLNARLDAPAGLHITLFEELD